MKLSVNQSLDIKENEIIINCTVMDDRLKKLINIIRQHYFSLQGIKGTGSYTIPLEDIIFIDSVDGKTFLYCSKEVYEYKDTLSSLEQMLLYTSFVRISKNCMMNLNELKSVRSYLNHRMEATMKNGEKLIVSRNYIDNLKKKLEE
ncbi:LytTR family DNA-binding domain-containing protein [Anaerocolumna sp. MB42-C2]|uniref:LytTR family DNA-binding domain-containing protein n=1 Tax=Anaerocolumna sp. MB42-C2 TaxID=3070997 RepID=UPI0027DED52F|nr:LytTR family DNA-binding domain-containing protein [Anaerocolumna sp. MB42-C2]WMJ90644.1 LytTR family DNA-binding domain-containing protein [Anaerocolumna sp. MB42-C2]